MPSPHPLFDTHVHLDLLPEGSDLETQMQEARRAGVEKFLVPGVSREGWSGLIALARSVPGVWAAPGIHPQRAFEWNQGVGEELAGVLEDGRAVAVGEIGLDALVDVPAHLQEEAFRGQLRLAIQRDLPVVIHCRKAMERLLSIIRQEGGSPRGGIFHAFSGSPESARQAVDLGFAIAFGGTITYPEARRAPEVLRSLPPESIVLETDAPDIPPHPHRRSDNRPSWLPLIANKVSEIRGWSLQEAARITSENARRVLKISP